MSPLHQINEKCSVETAEPEKTGCVSELNILEVVSYEELHANVKQFHDTEWKKNREIYKILMEMLVRASRQGKRHIQYRTEMSTLKPNINTLRFKLGSRYTCSFEYEHTGTCRVDHNVHGFGKSCKQILRIEY